MGVPPSPRVVAVLDSDPDTIEMMKTWLEFHGFVVVVGSLLDFRLGKDDLAGFLDRTKPEVIVYDLGIPYETNYRYLQTVSAEPAFARSSLVITTTNATAVRTLLGVEAIEVLGKPYDLDTVIGAIRAAADDDGSSVNPTVRSADRRLGERRQGDRRTGGDRRSGALAPPPIERIQ